MSSYQVPSRNMRCKVYKINMQFQGYLFNLHQNKVYVNWKSLHSSLSA